MTLQEAYIVAKMSDKGYEDAYLLDCMDFKDSWGFIFSPYPPDTAVGGFGYTTVNKETGEIGDYAPFTHGFDLWKKSKSVPLKSLKGLIRPAPRAPAKQKRAPRAAAAPQTAAAAKS